MNRTRRPLNFRKHGQRVTVPLGTRTLTKLRLTVGIAKLSSTRDHVYSEYKSMKAMSTTMMIKNSRKPIPISKYVNKSSFIDGLRAMPTTRAAKSWPIPDAQPPTATMAMAQPSTEVPEWRTPSGCCCIDGAHELRAGVLFRLGL